VSEVLVESCNEIWDWYFLLVYDILINKNYAKEKDCADLRARSYVSY